MKIPYRESDPRFSAGICSETKEKKCYQTLRQKSCYFALYFFLSFRNIYSLDRSFRGFRYLNNLCYFGGKISTLIH